MNVSLSSAVVGEIAGVHPRVAATVWMVVHRGTLGSEGSASWYNSPITASDVEALIQNGTVELERTPDDVVTYNYYLDHDPATGTRSLVIRPQKASDFDSPFSAFVLELNPAEGIGNYVTGEWSLF